MQNNGGAGGTKEIWDQILTLCVFDNGKPAVVLINLIVQMQWHDEPCMPACHVSFALILAFVVAHMFRLHQVR